MNLLKTIKQITLSSKNNPIALFLLFILLTPLSTIAQGAEPKPIKILAIGNSFSEDAIENYLYELANHAGHKTIIGNLYIGGAPLSLHLKNSQTNKAVYSYRKITLDGKKNTKEKTSLYDALHDEDWDYISFQQASPLSGDYSSIANSLPDLVAYVKQQVSDETNLLYHQTWAYQQNSTHKGFQNYGNNQKNMYRAIAKTSQKAYKLGYFEFLIPAGTAIQNARTSSIGDNFTRDGYHLQLSYGRFTAACTWFEKLFNMDVRNSTYVPEGMTPREAKIAKSAAHTAVSKPYKISKVKL